MVSSARGLPFPFQFPSSPDQQVGWINRVNRAIRWYINSTSSLPSLTMLSFIISVWTAFSLPFFLSFFPFPALDFFFFIVNLCATWLVACGYPPSISRCASSSILFCFSNVIIILIIFLFLCSFASDVSGVLAGWYKAEVASRAETQIDFNHLT